MRSSWFALLVGVVVLSGGVVGQDAKKETKKADPPTKVKGTLPPNWGKIGLTNDQKQEIYKIQAKYKAEIDALEAKIKGLKGTRDMEMKAVLNPDQKKKLAEVLSGRGK